MLKLTLKNSPWGEIGVDVVLECTGFYTSKEKSIMLISKQEQEKLLFPHQLETTLPTIVYNVNHETLTETRRYSNFCSFLYNKLSWLLWQKALNDLAPIESGIMCTIHAYTGDQMTLDGPQRKGDLRRSRAAAVNIVTKQHRCC